MTDKVIVDIKGIMALLPHRFPFLLVDRVEIIEEGKKVIGIKNVTMNEDCFNGHFPGNPVFPGVLQVEAMAQTGGVMFLRNPALQGKNVLFVSINNVKFRRMVVPGDQLVMEVESTRFGGRIAAMKAKATVNGERSIKGRSRSPIKNLSSGDLKKTGAFQLRGFSLHPTRWSLSKLQLTGGRRTSHSQSRTHISGGPLSSFLNR